ncbi:MAG: hypothetical protein MAG794_00983 [Gammaproteobacteria bacterium]|nr:hypothetical protein [Gammaproteobacteria bacterium]
MPRMFKKPGSGRAPIIDRRTVCEEAARIMIDHGISDYHFAKKKAAQCLGVSPRRTEFPSNRELADAVRVRLRLFDGDGLNDRYGMRLERAAKIMDLFVEFRPRLVGPLVDGIATQHGAVELHLFCDAAEHVMARLQEMRLTYRSYDRRVRFPPDRYEQVPGFTFEWKNSLFDILVFKYRRIRQAPLCPVEGRPMRRVSVDRVMELRREFEEGFRVA